MVPENSFLGSTELLAERVTGAQERSFLPFFPKHSSPVRYTGLVFGLWSEGTDVFWLLMGIDLLLL